MLLPNKGQSWAYLITCLVQKKKINIRQAHGGSDKKTMKKIMNLTDITNFKDKYRLVTNTKNSGNSFFQVSIEFKNWDFSC